MVILWGKKTWKSLENEGVHANHVGKTMPFLPPMTGNGKHIYHLFMVITG